ncbi:MAG TPA: DUF2214 family protein, partial [Gemmatimonadaceae bacterium]|nr:DUF2214 family protein [Gemmatimonadaceae bacterium]
GRARALHDSLREPVDERALKRALVADTWWGIAAVVWLVTGLWRLLASTEKSTSYYLSNHVFYAKMALFVVILALEAWPMVTLIRWRMATREPNTRDAGRIEVISYVECALVVAMVFAAVAMARGFGMNTGSSPVAVTDSLTALGDSAQAPPAEPSSAPSALPAATPSDLELVSRELAMPLAGIDPMKLHSNFSALRGGNRRHEALDIMAPRRTPVMSAASGCVLKLFTSRAGGLMVYAADSSERFILMYAHLDGYAPGLHEGDPLVRGQLIGYVGSTGNASPNAPHLHFAIARSGDIRRWSKGTPVDPLPLLQAAHR